MTYKIVIAPAALKMMKDITDRRIRDLIIKRTDDLKEDPEKQGKPLLGELSGYRSLRAAGQRYRIIYQVVKGKVLVYVSAVGIRREGSAGDIYNLAKKLIRLHLIDPHE